MFTVSQKPLGGLCRRPQLLRKSPSVQPGSRAYSAIHWHRLPVAELRVGWDPIISPTNKRHDHFVALGFASSTYQHLVVAIYHIPTFTVNEDRRWKGNCLYRGIYIEVKEPEKAVHTRASQLVAPTGTWLIEYAKPFDPLATDGSLTVWAVLRSSSHTCGYNLQKS